MAAIDFPNSPTTGQLFTVGDITWEWTGTVWQGLGMAAPPLNHALSHQASGSDPLTLTQPQITGLPLFNVGTPLNNQALVYDQSTQRWVNRVVSGESFSPFLMMGA